MKISEYKNKIEVGDWVKTNGDGCSEKSFFVEGEIGEIQKNCFFIWQNDERWDGSHGRLNPSMKGYKYSWEIDFDNDTAEITILKKFNNLKNKLMSLKEEFILTLTSEPKKSFRKAGVIDGDNLATDEGMRIFITWLLLKHYADDFKTEVVDDMLKKEKEEK
jgi:hypothetical protein